MRKYFLLPHRFKTIGLIVAFSSLLIIVMALIFGVAEPWRQSVKLSFYAVASLGLLLYILSKEKTEDEFILQIRLHCFVATTVGTVVGFLVNTIFVICFSAEYYPTERVILFQLIMYIIFFRGQLSWYKKGIE